MLWSHIFHKVGNEEYRPVQEYIDDPENTLGDKLKHMHLTQSFNRSVVNEYIFEWRKCTGACSQELT